jgi:hypothetical protein
MKPSALLLVLLLGLPATAHSEPPLGRLFHTPQQRDILDELRRRNAPLGAARSTEQIHLQGIVRLSSGRNTVWINGRAYFGDAPVASFGERSARIFIGDGKTAEIKVGEQRDISASPPSP